MWFPSCSWQSLKQERLGELESWDCGTEEVAHTRNHGVNLWDVGVSQFHYSPSSLANAFHLLSTRAFVVVSMTISSGHGREKPSAGHFRVASMPIFDP